MGTYFDSDGEMAFLLCCQFDILVYILIKQTVQFVLRIRIRKLYTKPPLKNIPTAGLAWTSGPVEQIALSSISGLVQECEKTSTSCEKGTILICVLFS